MYKIILAIRYLLKHRISYFAVIATASCVFVVLTVATVLDGVTSEVKNFLHNATGDCVVGTKSLVGLPYYNDFLTLLNRTDCVETAAPVIDGYANLIVAEAPKNVNNWGSDIVRVRGLSPALHSDVTAFDEWIFLNKDKSAYAFDNTFDSNLPGCIPGIGLLFESEGHNNYWIIDPLPLVKYELSAFPLTPAGAPAKAGLGEVSSAVFICSDYFETGYSSADWRGLCLPIDSARHLFGMDIHPERITAILIKFTSETSLHAGCEKIKRLWSDFALTKKDAPYSELLQNVRVQSWQIYNRPVVVITEIQQASTVIVFSLLAIITIFVVFVVFYMVVAHKTKDIGILKSLGVSTTQILILFLLFALFVGLLGSVLGASSGLLFLANFNEIHNWFAQDFGIALWYGSDYAIKDVPIQINNQTLMAIAAAAVTACLAGALLPAWRAAKLKPIQTIQVTEI